MRTTLALLAPLTLLACAAEEDFLALEADADLARFAIEHTVEIDLCLKPKRGSDCDESWLSGDGKDPKVIASSTQGASNDHPNPYDEFKVFDDVYGDMYYVSLSKSGFKVSDRKGNTLAYVHTGEGNLPTWIGIDDLVISDGLDLAFATEGGQAYAIGNGIAYGKSYSIDNAPFLTRADFEGGDKLGTGWSAPSFGGGGFGGGGFGGGGCGFVSC